MSKLPVWEQFMQRLGPTVERLGLTVEELSAWVTVSGTNGHRISVQKSVSRIPIVESTFPADLIGDPGECHPVSDNGRIRSRLAPDVIRDAGMGFVESMLEMLVDPNVPATESRRASSGRPSLADLGVRRC